MKSIAHPNWFPNHAPNHRLGPPWSQFLCIIYFEGWHPTTQALYPKWRHQVGEISGMWMFNGARLNFLTSKSTNLWNGILTIHLLITTLLYNLPPITIQVCKFCICSPLLNDDWFVALSGYVNLRLIFLWKKSVFEKSKGLQTHGFGPAVRMVRPSLQDGAHSGDRHSPWRVLQMDRRYRSYIIRIPGSWSIHSHRIYVSNIYLNSVDVYGKCG